MASSALPDVTSQILKHERLIVAAGIVLLVGLCWWFLAAGGGLAGHSGDGMAMPGMAAPPLSALVLMWSLMMVAMMLPSAAPTVLLYARVRSIRRGDADVAKTWIFLIGYIVVWLSFSLVAAVLQQQVAGSKMAVGSLAAQAALLIAAGAYQLSPLKRACLRQCRSPAQFISRYWRPGAAGALRLGILHGAYCVGCCWLLMGLLFVGGVMNFAWIAALTLLVAAEKLVWGGAWLGRAAGLALIGWGAYLLLA